MSQFIYYTIAIIVSFLLGWIFGGRSARQKVVLEVENNNNKKKADEKTAIHSDTDPFDQL